MLEQLVVGIVMLLLWLLSAVVVFGSLVSFSTLFAALLIFFRSLLGIRLSENSRQIPFLNLSGSLPQIDYSIWIIENRFNIIFLVPSENI